jgi:hypothetical protein
MMSKRMLLVATVLFFVIPPMLAFGWTRYRYSQGTVYPGVLPRVTAWTSGYTDRQYNSAYRSPDVCEAWRVRYYDSAGHITWQQDKECSPTTIGLTTGPRRAYCEQIYTGTDPNKAYAYNCDTTVP